MNQRCMFSIVPILFVFSCMTTYAQWSSDPATNTPICRAGNFQRAIQMISDDKGGAFICWTDERTASNFYAVHAQRIDKNGIVRWTQNGIAVSSVMESQVKPEMISDGTGGVIIVWADTKNGTSDIYAQRIDSLGNARWAAEGVPVASDPSEQIDPKIASDGQHGAIVVWSAHSGTGQDGHIHAQRIDGNGNVLWSPELVLSFSDQYEMAPCITSDGNGGAYVAWAFYNNQDYDVYAQRLTASGGQMWQNGGIPLTPSSGAQDTPSLLADGTGKAFLSYTSWASGSTPRQQIIVLNPDGTTAASLDLASASGAQRNPELALVATGVLGIAWEDGRAGSGKTRSYAQLINNAGTKSWSADGVTVSNRAGNQMTPHVIPDGNGGMIVSWEDMTAGITKSDVYAQKFAANGSPLWTAAGVPIATADKMQQLPSMTGDGAGGAIIAWEDYRASFTNSDIYASHVLADGTLPPEPAILTLSSRSLAFGSVSVGFSSTKSITLSNTGDQALTISAVRPALPQFSLTPENNTIGPNGSITAEVRFQPTSKDALNTFIVIESNSIFSPDTIVVTGTGTSSPEIAVDRRSLNFGTVVTGTSKPFVLTISNPGNDTLRISSIVSSNPVFTVAANARDILPGENFGDTVWFTPIAIGPVSGELTLTSNAPTSPTIVSLSGVGNVIEVTLNIDRTFIYFGDVPLGEHRDTTLTVTNTGNDTLRMNSFSSGDPHFTIETAIGNIAPAAAKTFSIRFTPTAEGSLNTFLILSSNAKTSPDTLVLQGAGIKVVSTRPLQAVPGVITLHENFPNPFRSSTSIRYDVESSAAVRLAVYDALGRLVTTLVDETQRPGSYQVPWSPVQAVPGVYYLVLRAGAAVVFGRMVIME